MFLVWKILHHLLLIIKAVLLIFFLYKDLYFFQRERTSKASRHCHGELDYNSKSSAVIKILCAFFLKSWSLFFPQVLALWSPNGLTTAFNGRPEFQLGRVWMKRLKTQR
jgi:hypothetical protein